MGSFEARPSIPRKGRRRGRMRMSAAEFRQTGDGPEGSNEPWTACHDGSGRGLSQDQYEAALRYLDIRNDYQKSLLSPGAYFEANGSVDSNDPGAYEDWCKRVKSAFNSAQEAIQEAQNENRSENLWAGLQCIIINDEMMHHFLGSARLVCNALHRHFMLDNKRKSPNK